MKTLTIKQPYASLIIEGYKEYEFRVWKTKYRGEFLIHAGKSIDKKAMERFKYLNLDYPTGCIIGKANITDCILVDNEMKKKLKEKDPIVYKSSINRAQEEKTEYAFKLENIEKVKPIYIKGKLSFFEYDYKVNE